MSYLKERKYKMNFKKLAEQWNRYAATLMHHSTIT